MHKFLAGCRYNEEEISRHLKKYIGYWPVQVKWQQVCNQSILKKRVEVVKGADFSWLSSKVSRTLCQSWLVSFVPGRFPS